ncbi:MAG: phosphate signaling complex protein PhoU [Proteobacteria bacterium]|jgi:phosphate transport system protein|nr:phosphate signaling complex protein PhoU [Pseudomonadota bacterium]MBU4229527.1 phosphate signaling complex protein PhoU [Pseudomonadota bacterium]MBU4413242.1 phosphate signaling complex protein PhoU [Pseudomonadota bacterium]MCG2822451.1 phosphate signaling complex protein PhoU [Desulfobulbaceae bacterium]PKN22427.1 MAG: phosphate transport system regulatory protein PhoU [Deltaproteobacteria bacterium HGW-Deltaproteobacteria-3]
MANNIQTEIEKLKKQIVYLGAAVQENMQNSVKALWGKNPDLARKVIATDKDEIDRMEISVEEECLRLLALHQPVAGDLRFIVTVLKIDNDLERIGDLAAKIADKVILLHDIDPVHFAADGMQIPEMFNAMFAKTIWMFQNTMEAFVNEDTDLAYKVCLEDDEVDRAKGAIRTEMEEIIMRDPAQQVYLAKLISVARSMERIADHCTNICEDIIYMAQGKIVRHHIMR